MSKKISLDELMNDVLYLSNQIKGLNLLMEQKKLLCKEYFQKSGQRSISNDQLTIYTQERTKVNYDMDSIMEKLPKDNWKRFIEYEVEITDKKALLRLLKEYNVPKQVYNKCLLIYKKVNEEKLSKLYDSGEVSVEDLEGCYTADTKLSIALKVKNTNAEISV